MLRNYKSISKNFFSVTLLSLASTFLIFSPILNILVFDNKRVFELIIISYILLSIVLTSHHQNIFYNLNNPQKFKVSILLLLGTAAAFLAKQPFYAFLELSLYIGLFYLFLTLGKIIKKNNHLIQPFFFIIFPVSALFYQTNFFTAFLASFIENTPLQWPEPFSGFSNVRFFNQYQIWSITLLTLPLLIYPSLDNRIKIFLKIIATGWVILLFASASRGAPASAVLAMLITLFIFKDHAKPFLKLNSLILLSGFVGYLLLFKLIPVLLENQIIVGWKPIENITTSSGRAELWKYAIQYIIDNPWLGIGPMHYAYYPGPTHAHPHNSLLQWASEMGIPSTLLVISLIYSGLSAWIKKFYRLTNENKLYAPSHLWIALFCSLCSGLIYSLVSGVIVMPLSQIMMTLIAGWMLGIYFQDQQAKPVSQNQHIAFMLLAGATLITLTYTILPSLLPRLISYQDLPYQDYPTLAPRFWQIGGIPH